MYSRECIVQSQCQAGIMCYFIGVLQQSCLVVGQVEARWSYRWDRVVLSQYENVLTHLEEMGANYGTSTGAKANGNKERFDKTMVGLLLAVEVTEILECLNKSLQKQTETIAYMKSAIDCVRFTVQGKRSETGFHVIFDKAVEMVESLGSESIQLPYQRPTNMLDRVDVKC